MAFLRLISVGFSILLAIAAGFLLTLLPSRATRQLSNGARVGFSRLACRALGLDVHVEGTLPSGHPVLLAPNHASWTDVLVLGGVTPMVFLARHDLANWPLLGRLARAYGTIFINRGRKRAIPEVNQRIAAEMSQNGSVVMFPEGTTGDGTRLQKFHSSHFEAPKRLVQDYPDTAAFVVPVAIAYLRRGGLPLGRTGRAALAWYGDTEFAPHLLDLVRGGRTCCHVQFLPAVPIGAHTCRKAVARETSQAIQCAFRGKIMMLEERDRAGPYVLSSRQVV